MTGLRSYALRGLAPVSLMLGVFGLFVGCGMEHPPEEAATAPIIANCTALRGITSNAGSVEVGQTVRYTATYAPGCTPRPATWSSSNLFVADVVGSLTGVAVDVSTKGIGTTIIAAQLDTSIFYSSLRVFAIPVATVSVTAGATTLHPGDALPASAVLRSSSGIVLDYWYNITWTTGNDQVATVSANPADRRNAIITAVGVGTVTITVTGRAMDAPAATPAAVATLVLSVTPVPLVWATA